MNRQDIFIGPFESKLKKILNTVTPWVDLLRTKILKLQKQYCIMYDNNVAGLQKDPSRTGSVVFRTDFRISGCWRTTREGRGA
jgi:hypothetical protein